MNCLKALTSSSVRGFILACIFLGVARQVCAEIPKAVVEVTESTPSKIEPLVEVTVSGNKLSDNSATSGNAMPSRQSSEDRALEWLALHQEADGSWDSTKYEGQMLRSASTAMALLPMLGAGHCESAGKYRKNVRKGIRYLNDLMKDPVVSYETIQSDFFSSALVLYVLSEASIFGASPETENNANVLAEYLMALYKNRMLKNSGFGDVGDWCDSMWFTLAIKSAKAVELPIMKTKIAQDFFASYKYFLAKETAVWTWRLEFLAQNPKIEDAKKTWVLMFQNQFVGTSRQDPFLKIADEATCALIKNSKWMEGEIMKDPQVLYFLTLAAFQQQGNAWDQWNPIMKKIVVNFQQKGDSKEFGGSWDPAGERVVKKGGRIFYTALIVLCEINCYHYHMR